jgi:hypothetical protein
VEADDALTVWPEARSATLAVGLVVAGSSRPTLARRHPRSIGVAMLPEDELAQTGLLVAQQLQLAGPFLRVDLDRRLWSRAVARGRIAA